MADNSFNKEKLRNHFLKKRNNLSGKEVEEKSQCIIDRILKMKVFQQAQTFHSYVSIQKNNEVDTIRFLEICLQMGKNLVVPKMIGEGKLSHIRLDSLKDLRKNSLGVPEPVGGRKFSVDDLDLVIVPMVAGDRKKNRIGYGAGYYDRFLTNCSAPKIGLLFDCQLYDDTLPVENFDIPLDILITESGRIV